MAFAQAGPPQSGTIPRIAPQSTSIFLFNGGDSQSSNTGSREPYPVIYAGGTSIFLDDEAVPGEGCDFTLATEVPRGIASKNAHPGYAKYAAGYMIGVNDIAFPQYYDPTSVATLASSAQTLANCIGSIATALHAGGFSPVVVGTLPDYNGKGTNGEIWREFLNADIIALYPATVEGVSDFGGTLSGIYGSAQDKSLARDGLHMVQKSQNVVAQPYGFSLNGTVAGATAPAAPASIAQPSVSTKSDSIVLTWASPGQVNSGAGYFSDFTTQYRVQGSSGPWITYSHTPSQTPQALLTGLTPNTIYSVQIQANGPHGNSAFVPFTTSQTLALTPDTLDPGSFYLNAPGCALSNANMTVGVTGNVTSSAQEIGCTIRTNRSASTATGKWYAEFTMDSLAFGNAAMIGVCDSTFAFTMPFSGGLGLFFNSAGTTTGGTGAQLGFTLANAISVNFQQGDIIGEACDMAAQKCWIADNNTWATGDPATGASPTWTWSSIALPLFPCLELDFTPSQVTYAGSATHYPPPTGFSPL